MGGQKFKKHIHLLGMISDKNRNKAQREALIRTMNREQLGVVKKMVGDFLKAEYPVPRDVLKKLVRNRAKVRELASPKTKEGKLKKFIKQNGGFLSALLPIAGKVLLPALASVLGGS